MSEKGGKSSSPDIFQLLEKAAEKEEERQREELLPPLGVEEIFLEGSININKQTCQGIECKLCVEACPTNALFWKAGEIGILPE
ncbi:MAG: 4Fe-4S binding protein, partial [Candidatus Bathyarchaeota archaeon]